MSKKAIYTVAGIYFFKIENAKAEAEKNGNQEKPKKSFVSEEEFLQMAYEGLIIDFEAEQPQAEENAPAVPDMAEMLQRLEALEAENQRLKQQKPADLEQMKKLIERRELLDKERALLNMQADNLLDLDLENGRFWDAPTVKFSANPSSGGGRVDLEISNPVVVEEFRGFLVTRIGEKCKAISEELAGLEEVFA